MIITLLEKNVAKEGYRFTHMGSAKICETCPFYKVCVESLQEYNTYIVKTVRKKEHPCLIDNQTMLVCEVEEANLILTVKKQKFLADMLFTREPNNCKEILCENYDYCVSPAFDKPTKIKILKEKKEIKCPLNYDLVLVEAHKV